MRIIAVIIIVLCLSACDTKIQPRGDVQITHFGATNDAGSRGIHMVRSGQSLSVLAARYRLPEAELARANGLSAPYRIYPNQRLYLPPPRDYRVRAGDSIFSIGRLFEIQPRLIVKLNQLAEPYTIYPDQVIKLPGSLSKLTAAIDSNDRYLASLPEPQAKPTLAPQRKIIPRNANRSWPVHGDVISSFGTKADGLANDGINIASSRGSDVKAFANGQVLYIGDSLPGYGRLVLLRHNDGLISAYAHLDTITVSKGQLVAVSEQIGTVGSSGGLRSPQLHFEIRKNKQPVDPMTYLPQA